MGKRKINFINGEYYHIFNRGVDKRIIFLNKDFQYLFLRRMLELNNTDISNNIREFRNRNRNKHKKNIIIGNGEELVKIVAFCLLPNHFHFILKQCVDKGISKFMQRLGTSYSILFNTVNKRTGNLFQGRFKAKHISGDFSLPTVATYINLNYKHHGINPQKSLVKSSIFEYIGNEDGNSICDKDEVKKVIQMIGSITDYKNYAKQISIYFSEKRNILLEQESFEF